MQYSITHGIDIIQLNRPELNDLGFAIRFMTKQEYDIFKSIEDKFQQKVYFCSIWCLKEAIIKATNHKYLFSYINIILNDHSAPIVSNIDNINLSISYEQDYIIGSAIWINQKNKL